MGTYPNSILVKADVTNEVDDVDQNDHNILKGEIIALQTYVGTNPHGSRNTLTERLAVSLATDGSLRKGTSFPVDLIADGTPFYRTDLDTAYIYDGSAWDQIAISASQVFSSSGTFTPPSGVSYVFVTLCGGGGGGSGSQGGGVGRAGGGAGAFVVRAICPVTVGSNYSVVCGSAGIAGPAGNGTGGAGGTSQFNFDFGGLIQAAGGNGALANTAGAAGGSISTVRSLPGTAGSGTTGGVNTSQDARAYAVIASSGASGGNGSGSGGGGGGAGGSGPFGVGGAGGDQNNPGQAGSGYGAGGGGGGDGTQNGGAGSPGIVYVEW